MISFAVMINRALFASLAGTSPGVFWGCLYSALNSDSDFKIIFKHRTYFK